ncbi:hypothetical protein SE17_40910, partial [Kouleothrix aurantiaca]
AGDEAVTIAAILPCRGRPEQTSVCVRRLLATAGMQQHGTEWTLYLAGGQDEHAMIAQIASEVAGRDRQSIVIATAAQPRLSYWQALAHVTQATTAPLLATLANDLLPGMHWLRRAVDAYQEAFGNGSGLLGFNGDSHGVEHSCHVLVDRDLLTTLGGWPVWYQHNFGDTELCARTTQLGRYAKAPWALLYHNHPFFGGADDATYAEGRASSDADERLYHERKRAGWPTVSPSSSPPP